MTHLFSSLRTMGMCHSTDEDHTHPRVKTHERVIWHRPADLGSVDCDDIGSTGPFKGTWMRDPAGGGGGATSKTTLWEGGHRVLGIARSVLIVWHHQWFCVKSPYIFVAIVAILLLDVLLKIFRP